MQDNQLHEEYTIDTPENVTFGYTIAGIGSRFIGALIDTSLLLTALLLLNIAILLALSALAGSDPPAALDAEPSPNWVAGLLIALYALCNFAVIWGYYLLFELLWNGQTPGKRLAHTQVVQIGGSPAGFTDIAIRNLVRIVDFMPLAYGVGFLVMFSNRRARRLGDFAANTVVIRRQDAVKLADLTAAFPPPSSPAASPLSAEQAARFPALAQIRAQDYRLLCDVLARAAPDGAADPLMHRLALALAVRSGAAPPAPDGASTRQFLSDLADALRSARA